ncbi:MAG: hypothetical protein M3Y87_01200 [Myxococcota bacterium]|nr:hypothetical protein [Myxococcota bacterium]
MRGRSAKIAVFMALAVSACGGSGALEPATSGRAPGAASARAPGGEATSVSLPISTGTAFHAFLPRPTTSFGAAVAGGRLYVLGGYDGTPHAYTSEHQSGQLWSVDLETGREWRQHAGVEGVQGLALVAHGDRVCRIGGMRADASGAVRSIDEAACFDPAREQWEDLPSLPAPRSSHDAIVVDGTAYVVGGWELVGSASEGRFHTTMLSLDLGDPASGWTEREVPFRRRALGLAAIGSKLVAVGGMDESREVSRRVDVLDIGSGAWSSAPELPEDAFGVAVEGVGDRLFASTRDGVVRALRLDGGAWEVVGSLAFPRFFHHLVARSPGELLAVGGIRGMTDAPRTQHVESIAITPSEGPRVVAMEMPYPGRTKNRQGVILEGDRLHLFGGNVSLEQHDFEPQHFSAEHHVLDLASSTWSRGADYPFARQTIQTASVPGAPRAVAIGGFGHDGTVARTHPESFDYVIAEDRWEPRAALPVARSQFGLARHGDRLWIFGGLDYDPSREGEAAFEHLTTILSAPAEGGAFETVPVEMTAPRRAFGGAVLGDRYYVVGGMAGEFQLVTDCQAFDFEARTWAPIACPRRARLNPQLVAIGERLYLVGGTGAGEGGLAPERSVEVYDPATNSWSVLLEDIGIEPRHLRAFEHRGRLMLVSTHTEEPVLRLVLIMTSNG